MKWTYVYTGEGVSPYSELETTKSLKLAGFSVRTIDAEEVISGQWRSSCELFVMPGGRDAPYQESLGGEGNDQLRSYVTSGGSYLGLCAGAYYACRTFDFDTGGVYEMWVNRELKFFPGHASGPAFGSNTWRNGSEVGARAALLKLDPDFSVDGIDQAYVYYNGGCYFDLTTVPTPNTRILATYAELNGSLPAIIECRVGAGTAILCGVHPEYRSVTLSPSDYPQDTYLKLVSHDAASKKIFYAILHKLTAPVRQYIAA